MFVMSFMPSASIRVVAWLRASFPFCCSALFRVLAICSIFSLLTKPLAMGMYPGGGVLVKTVWMASIEKPMRWANSV